MARDMGDEPVAVGDWGALYGEVIGVAGDLVQVRLGGGCEPATVLVPGHLFEAMPETARLLVPAGD